MGSKVESLEWTSDAKGQLLIPERYVKDLAYEIIVLSAKKLMTFQCVSYELDGQVCKFKGALLDTSERNARGKVTLQRFSYHAEVILGNTGFMAIPIPELSTSPTPES